MIFENVIQSGNAKEMQTAKGMTCDLVKEEVHRLSGDESCDFALSVF